MAPVRFLGNGGVVPVLLFHLVPRLPLPYPPAKVRCAAAAAANVHKNVLPLKVGGFCSFEILCERGNNLRAGFECFKVLGWLVPNVGKSAGHISVAFSGFGRRLKQIFSVSQYLCIAAGSVLVSANHCMQWIETAVSLGKFFLKYRRSCRQSVLSAAVSPTDAGRWAFNNTEQLTSY